MMRRGSLVNRIFRARIDCLCIPFPIVASRRTSPGTSCTTEPTCKQSGCVGRTVPAIICLKPMPESPEAPVCRYLKQLFALSKWFGATFAFGLFLLSSSPPIAGQEKPGNGAAWRPPELVATDKDIRDLL